MAKRAEANTSGTADKFSPQIVGGTRRRVYQQDEQLVMINKDKFDALQSVSRDRNLFSHLASIFLTFGVTFGAEKGIEYLSTPTSMLLNQLLLSGACVGFGVLFLVLAGFKIFKHYRLKKGLFADENLLSDEIIIHKSDGTSTVSALTDN